MKEYLTCLCGQCKNHTTMEIVAQYSQVASRNAPKYEVEWDAGPIWRIALCPACYGVNFIKLNYHSEYEPDDWETKVLYPCGDNDELIGLPPQVESEYKAALSVRSINSNAYATLLGRVIDKVCIDRGAEGDSFYNRLQSLSRKGEIPSRLADMAHQLRILRNIGAHADLGDLSQDEVPILDSLCSAILEYVYVAPRLIANVEQRIAQVKKKQQK